MYNVCINYFIIIDNNYRNYEFQCYLYVMM